MNQYKLTEGHGASEIGILVTDAEIGKLVIIKQMLKDLEDKEDRHYEVQDLVRVLQVLGYSAEIQGDEVPKFDIG